MDGSFDVFKKKTQKKPSTCAFLLYICFAASLRYITDKTMDKYRKL